MDINIIKSLLDSKVEEYEQASFIEKDPISIPHLFSSIQDIEISGFFAAILAWGNRTTIINSCKRILSYMDNAPYDFILNHNENDYKQMLSFVHRTFNATDLIYSLHRLQIHYKENNSLQNAFYVHPKMSTENALIHFHNYFFNLEELPERTRKHIATPQRKSACKRLNMYLRWMVRQQSPVDFGIWKDIPSASLMIPLDTHTSQVSRKLGILNRTQNDWKSVVALTHFLQILDKEDPVKYDYALFALGAEERYQFKNK